MVFGIKNGRCGNIGNKKNSEDDVTEVVLPFSKLRFCGEQLQNLNYIFTKNVTRELEPEYEKSLLLATSVAERLVQRLVCGIGILDNRFCSKFLVALHDTNINTATPNLEYIIRLDSLSQPPLYATDEVPKYSITEGDLENCPPGYARIRLHPPCNKAWAEFINPTGYLRRDKIQAKAVELLAKAASANFPVSSLLADDSILCGSPGKVVDAFTLYNILQKPSNEHIFYGEAGKNPRFPDPRDFKLAILDKPNGIFIRIGFISPALTTITVEVRLIVAIGLEAWPSSTNFPSRITMTHSDCVLYHRAAQTGMFLTGYGVHSSAWQIRLPAAESFLEKHYSATSAVSIIKQTLCNVPHNIDEEYRRHQVVYRILNRYTMRSCLFYELEEDSATPTKTILTWSPLNISTIVLKILDKLFNSLRKQTQPNYIFPNANLFVNPGHLCEDDYVLEANKIKAYMLKLFDVSLTPLRVDEEFNKFLVMQGIEVNLLKKWKELVDGLVPVARKARCCIRLRGGRYNAQSQYSNRQVEYIGTVLKNMLVVKHLVLQTPDEVAWAAILNYTENSKENAIEDIIYILTTIIQQARDEYINNLSKNPKQTQNLPTVKTKIGDAISSLLELMRKEEKAINAYLLNDATLVNIILKWLYKGLEHKKKYLRVILKPYLKKLYTASHGVAWHLEAIHRRNAVDEVNSLCVYAKLVNSGRITPAQGLVDAVLKKWIWAREMLDSVQDTQLRVIFAPERGKVTKHVLSLPSNEGRSKSLHDLKKTGNDTSSLRKTRYCISTLLLSSDNEHGNAITTDLIPPHCILRNTSVMTATILKLHRTGEHRCSGDVLATLITMQKADVVREVSTLLREEERVAVLDAIQKLQTEKNAQTLLNSKSQNSKNDEKYTPKEESAGIKEEQVEGKAKAFASKRWSSTDLKESTLIGSCRAARARNDNSVTNLQDSFQMNSLRKHFSFKY